MPLPFLINPAAIPLVPTRKALMILDLQNDFVSPEGALYTPDPHGYVERILELAKAFRDSGAGDVIWVRTEFERNCALVGDCPPIVTSDVMIREKKGAGARGRQPTSAAHERAAMENDEEAFLSVGTAKDKKPCARKGTAGADFAPQVKAAVVAGRDLVFTKSHYSAFASGQQQLVQILRGRFVTQMYICGALTNISIYATALGAGQHGYEVTLVEDCCGYRSMMRHLNAVRQLDHLAGCQAISFDSLLEQLRPRPTPAAAAAGPSLSTGLSPSISKISLDLDSGSRDEAPPAPSSPPPAPEAKPASPHAGPDKPRRGSSTHSTGKGERKRPLEEEEEPKGGEKPKKDTGHPGAESDQSSSAPSSPKPPSRPPASSSPHSSSSSDHEPQHSREKKVKETEGTGHPPKAKRSELQSSKGPVLPPGADSAQAEQPRAINQVEQQQRQEQHRPQQARQRESVTATTATATTTTTAFSPPSELAIADESSARESAEPEPEVRSATPSPISPRPPEPTTSQDSMAERQTSPPAPPPQCGEPLCEGDTHVITNVLPPASRPTHLTAC
ncbi:hypothetical protein VTH06DRAFT_7448 [Thermothelomyces fergusii]